MKKQMTYDTQIYKGTRTSINPDLSIIYQYDFQTNGDYVTVKRKKNGGYMINPSFSITISEGFEKNRIFLPGMYYYPFTTLLEKIVKQTSENLFTLFPDINKMEFEIDAKALERFQTEKALMVAGMTASPCIWVNKIGETFPAIQIKSKYGMIEIPLEDAIPIVELLKGFDPMVYSISMLRFFGKFDD